MGSLRFYALLPLLAAGLLFSFSRTAFVAGIAGMCWLALSAFATPAAPGVRRALIPSAIITAVTLIIVGTVYAEPLSVRAMAVGRLEERSISDRFIQVSDALRLFSDHPLFGTGLDRMPYRVRAEVDSGRDWWRYDYVHDVPLLAAVETGIFGFLAWIACVALGLRAAWRRLRHRTRDLTGTTAFAACFIALVVAGLFDHFLWTSWFGQLMFWIILGMLHVAAEQAHKAHHQV
jgi:O-antigen ligase